MKSNYSLSYCHVLLPLSLFLFSQSTQALTPEQYQEQRNNALQQALVPNPLITIDTDPFKDSIKTVTDVDKRSTDTCFEINHLYLTGELAEQFTFAINPFTRGQDSIIGSCMNVASINNLITAIQNSIIDKGYITTRVLVQNQNLSTGNLNLSLVPGRIGQISADMVQASRPIYTDGTNLPANFMSAMPMSAGDLLNVRDIEQTLENFKRVPTADASFSIAPSIVTSEPGYSDILISWQQDKRFRLLATLDDSGQENTGKYQAGLTVSLDNPTWHNDVLYASYSQSLEGVSADDEGNSWSYNVGYTLPIGNNQLTLTHSGYDYEQVVAGAIQDYNYSGESYTTDANISHLIHRDSHSKTYLKGGMFAKHQRNYIDDTEVEVQRRKTGGYQVGLGYDTAIGRSKILSDITYQRGTGAFDAMVPPESLFNEGSARTGIIKTSLDLNYPFKLSNQTINYHANVKGQYAEEALVPNDRFSIGGRYSVRGFDGSRSLSGDHGALIRQELSAAIGETSHAIYAGVDAGYVKMDNNWQDELLLGNHLIGGVIGIKGKIPLVNIDYNVFTGYPIEQPDNFSDKEWVTSFGLAWQY